ncbi:MAG: ATPase, T2SS/T4P/T4SS family [Alphaproteobacteria bacterium]|nr:ATPase, T2SS/T4P/T4SS family [Alphaproteobacteria bacterium]
MSGATIYSTPFSDIYITPDKTAYIPDDNTNNGLKILKADDFDEFFKLVSESWDGKNPSYSVLYSKSFYRVERSETIYGTQYCARRMPVKVPPFSSLGFGNELSRHLLSLGDAYGLILCSGPTGQGKTTTISSLLKEFLSSEGGFAYTIEDPTEQPLDGTYNSVAGGIGLCKQTVPPGGDWGAALKSALRTKPRYILVGEIRTPETASEVLRAATSGHLILSTIHANNVTDAINSVVKYASSTSMSEELAYDLFSRGMLGVMHQQLIGVGVKKPLVSHLFANPDTTKGDQVRGIIKSGKLNLATAIETQMTRMARGMNIFPDL